MPSATLPDPPLLPFAVGKFGGAAITQVVEQSHQLRSGEDACIRTGLEGKTIFVDGPDHSADPVLPICYFNG